MNWTLDGMREDYDWRHAVDEAFGRGFSWSGAVPPEFALFGEVVAASAGANDEESWIAVFRLHDGRYVFISAWCDYTGWDCQAGGEHFYAPTLLDLAKAHIGDEERERLGIDLAALEAS